MLSGGTGPRDKPPSPPVISQCKSRTRFSLKHITLPSPYGGTFRSIITIDHLHAQLVNYSTIQTDLGPVVRKLISANPGLKVNQGFNTLV